MIARRNFPGDRSSRGLGPPPTARAVSAVIRAELNLVGLAMRAERKVIDKIVDGLKFHS